MSTETRAALLREQTECGHPEAETTTGIVAYLDSEPVGWCAVEPRTAYPRLATARIPWAGRREDPADDGVWSVTCFVVRAGFRQQGIGRALAQASVDFARERGARSLEGYALIPEPGREVMWGELFVGSRSMFAAAGFAEVGRPSPRRGRYAHRLLTTYLVAPNSPILPSNSPRSGPTAQRRSDKSARVTPSYAQDRGNSAQ